VRIGSFSGQVNAMAKRILVVEDEAGIQELLRLNLAMAGFEVDVVPDVDAGWHRLGQHGADLMLVDWNMPGRPGVWLVNRLRADAAHKHVPVIMLTARDDEQDKLQAFESGVDDYVTKPFRPRELIARIHALLRRSVRDKDMRVIEVDGLCLNHDARRVTVRGMAVDMGPTEYRLLHFLVSHPMRVHSRQQLLDHVWGDVAALQERTVDAYVGRLRTLLESAGHPPCIETVRSVGYRLVRHGAVGVAHTMNRPRTGLDAAWIS
jgi:two-component system phosphate regulon response regulator PhoB